MVDYSIDIIKDTSYTIELNEQGPQGIQGERGMQGPEGPVGPKGDKGDVGEKGDTGVSVVGVEQISKVGLVATYRMTFSDGTHFDYQVTDGSIDGLTREVIINMIGYEPASYTSVEGLTTRVTTLEERVEDLTASKFPNVVIIGTPHIEGGQVSGFSNTNYLQFPFVDISRGMPFDIYFSFTTGSDVVTQQNVLDSYFGIALAIQNSKGVMALSSNGTSWDIGNVTGTNTILPNTTYYAKCSWTGTQYNASLSTNDTTYVPDIVLNSTLTTNKTTIFIGGSPDLFGAGTAHPFKGTINFNKSRVDVQGATVWEGMADVGLASRANVSLNNLDEVGEKRFTDIQIALDDKADKDMLNNPYSLFDSKYSDHELNNLSWLKSEGQWNSKAVYPSAYDKLLKVYNGTETVEGLSVKLSTEEYTDYDFVLNTADETFRLPLKTKQKFYDEVAPVVGNGNALGVTNGSGTGALNISTINSTIYSGNISKPVGTVNSGSQIYNNNYVGVGITTDPTKSGIETHLTEITLYLYFYVGETVQNANLIDAGRIGEQLANKVDTSNTQWATNACMPDYSGQISIPRGNTEQTYTAPSNGFIGYNFLMYGNNTGYVKVNDITVITNRPAGGDFFDFVSGIIPVNKNDVIKYWSNSSAYDYNNFQFYPMKGAN